MEFIRRNINKTSRNGEILASNVTTSSKSYSSGGGSSSSGGNYLPATNNGDGTYTVSLDQVLFTGHIVAEGEVTAYKSGITSGETSGVTGVIDIEDNLTSERNDAALSANQGRILKQLIDEKEVDLSDYYTKSQVDEKLTKIDVGDVEVDLSNYYNKDETDTKLNNKLNSSIWDSVFSVNSDGSLKVKVNLYGDGEISAFGSGTTSNEINLTNYYTKDEIDSKLDNIECTGGTTDVDLSNYYTKAQVNTKLGGYSETSHTHNYTSTVKVGTTDYAVKDNVISLPAYPTLSTLGAASSTNLDNHTANTTAHVTSSERTSWNTAYNNNHTHSNKSVIDGITSTKVNNWDDVVSDWDKVFEINSDGSLKVKVNLYGEGEISAFGSGSTDNEINLTNYYTKQEIDTKLDNLDIGDVDVDLSNYYTKAQVNTKLGDYSTTSHSHSNYSVTSHTHSNYSTTGHTHSISNITNLQSTLDGKSGTGHSHSNYSVTSHTHPQYASSSHTHSISNITNLQTTLDGKSGTGHSHSNYSITSHTHALSALTSTAHTHSYVPISASTTTLVSNAQSGVINFNSTAADTGIRLYNGGNNKGGVWWGSTTGMYLYNTASAKYIGVLDNGTPYYFDGSANRTLVHSNNSGHTHNYAGSSSAGGAATSANKVNSTLSWSGYNSGSFNGSGAASFTIPSNTNQLTNGAGFITSGATVAAANKLATSRTLWGQSFNGTANVTGNITGSYFKINDTSSNPYLQLTQGSTWYIQGYNNYLYLGAGSTKSLRVDATGNCLSVGEVTAHSDKRLKDNIQPLTNRGYITPTTYIKDGKESIGFIAQDMQKLYPELVTVDESTEEKYLTVNYMQYTAVLQAQIIELSKEIQELKDKLNDIYNKE